MLIFDLEKTRTLSNQQITDFTEDLNESVAAFVEKPNVETYARLRNRWFIFNGGALTLSEELDRQSNIADYQVRSWLQRDKKLQESVASEKADGIHKFDLPKSHKDYTQAKVSESLFDLQVISHVHVGKSATESLGAANQKTRVIIDLLRHSEEVKGLLDSNRQRYLR